MKRNALCLTISALVSLSHSSMRTEVQPAPKPLVVEPTREAYIRIDKIFNRQDLDQGSHEYRDGINKIRDYGNNEGARIQSEYQRYEELHKALETGGKHMEPEVRVRKSNELDDLKAKISRDVSDIQKVQASQMESLEGKVFGKIQKLAQDHFVDKQGWDAINVTGAMPLAGAIAISKRVDVTGEFLTLLNKEYAAQKAKESTGAIKPALPSKPSSETKK